MSVICRVLGSNHMTAFAKGAPEKIFGMCLEQSIPNNYVEKLTEYTAQGYRVIAVAYKPLSPKLKLVDTERKIKREAVSSKERVRKSRLISFFLLRLRVT